MSEVGEKMSKIDLILLNYNDAQNCIDFIKAHHHIEMINHFVIVDNNSTDDSVEKIEKITNEKVILLKNDVNNGYASGNNVGYLFCINNFDSDYLIISNPDVVFDFDCIASSISILKNNSELLICAPRMKNINGVPEYCAWDNTTWFRYAWETLPFTKRKKTFYCSDYKGKDYLECDCVAGSFFVVNPKRIGRKELFDPNTFLYCEETILAFLNGPKRAASISNVFFTHAHSQSISKSYKTALKRQTKLWESKMYVLINYYRIGFFRKLVVNIIKTINLFCVFLTSTLKK